MTHRALPAPYCFALEAYGLLTTALSVVAGPLGWCIPRGRIRMLERYGRWGTLPPQVIWLHAASLGEAQGLLPLVHELRSASGGLPILFTATSPTGLECAAPHVDEVRLLPFDGQPWIASALQRTSVRLFVTSEKELWPLLLHRLQRDGVPCALVNAVRAPNESRASRLLREALAPLINGCAAICCVDEHTAAMYRRLGGAAARIQVVGNTKYDRAPSLQDAEERTRFRATLFTASSSPLVVLGSVRPGEEEWWLDATQQLRAAGHGLQLVLAPRHPERFEYFAGVLAQRGIEFDRRSVGAPARSSTLLLDTLGELERAYSCANLAFIGGSIVPEGGHNPLEAAAYGAPLAMGQYTGNVHDLTRQLEERGALIRVTSAAQVHEALRAVVTHSPLLRAQGQRAKELWREQQGATARTVHVLTQLLSMRAHDGLLNAREPGN